MNTNLTERNQTPVPAAAPAYVLVVDDEPVVRMALSRGLIDAGYACVMAGSGAEALTLLGQHRFDVMLCDMRMPGMNGLEVLDFATAHDPDMPVIMVTALAGLNTALEAMRTGAYDYVTKPFTLSDVEYAVRRALDYRQLRLENRRHIEHLEDLVNRRTHQIREIALGVITTLGLALEAKSEWTHDHSRRVAELSAALGQRLGLSDAENTDLRLAGLLYDIGKIGVREEILHKPGALTPQEYAQVKQHPDLGARILGPLHELERVIPLIRHHHERWDGQGYPGGLAGERIPMGARIIGLADAYVAMRERRPYRRGMLQDQALVEIRLGARKQFDLRVVHALLNMAETGALDRIDSAYPPDVPNLHLLVEEKDAAGPAATT